MAGEEHSPAERRVVRRRIVSLECRIAGKSVGVSLRHGGGLGEPRKRYVRCEERECQYVDLNEPPCPLRVEMFADGSEHRVADYLAANAGTRVCFACLAETVGITHEQVRRASWQLKDPSGVVIAPSRCRLCRRRRVTIGFVSDAVVSSRALGEPSRESISTTSVGVSSTPA